MAFSGINGGNCIISSIAKTRLEAGIIQGAEIFKVGETYRVQFTGNGALWNGERLILSSARQPYEPRIFKSIDGAMSAIVHLGITAATIDVA